MYISTKELITQGIKLQIIATFLSLYHSLLCEEIHLDLLVELCCARPTPSRGMKRHMQATAIIICLEGKRGEEGSIGKNRYALSSFSSCYSCVSIYIVLSQHEVVYISIYLLHNKLVSYCSVVKLQ